MNENSAPRWRILWWQQPHDIKTSEIENQEWWEAVTECMPGWADTWQSLEEGVMDGIRWIRVEIWNHWPERFELSPAAMERGKQTAFVLVQELARPNSD